MSNQPKKRKRSSAPLLKLGLQDGDATDQGLDTSSSAPVEALPMPVTDPDPAPVPEKKSRAKRTKVEDRSLETLELPNDAVVALRKSGGLRFSSRTLIIHRDGRATFHGGPTSGNLVKTVPLEAAIFGPMMRDLLDVDFSEGLFAGGRQSPDGYVYEIAARISRRLYSRELFTGKIPESFQPLIEQIEAAMIYVVERP
jgi:hypothetical protein